MLSNSPNMHNLTFPSHIAMDGDLDVSKMSIEDGENTNEEGSGPLFDDETSQSGGYLKPGDGTV